MLSKALPGVDALAEPLADGSSWASPLVWGALAVAWLAAARPFPAWFELSTTQALLASRTVSFAAQYTTRL